MISDSSFWLSIKYPYWGIFLYFFSEVPSCCWVVWLSLFMVIGMFDGSWQILYCTSDIRTKKYSSLLNEIVFGQWYEDEWSLLSVYLMNLTSDIHTRAYSSLFDEIVFRKRYIDRWSLLVVYLMTLTSNLIPGHIAPFSLSILEIRTMTNLVLDWVLVWGFRRLTVSGPPYMDLLR